tara:strand:+ start:506 stop:1591 length:1086 start_codon:yes stop_codon:yes gene_type:complete
MIYPWYKPFVDNKKISNKLVSLAMTNNMTMGNEVVILENKLKKLLNVKYVVLTTSGTSALLMAYIALECLKNKKILTTNLSWIASINPALLTSCNIKLVDTYKNNQCVDFELLFNEIKKFKPDILVLVHLNGDIYYNDKLNYYKKKYNFKIIEDAAQSFLTKDKKTYCGTKYEIGCFSLGITKLINMVYGGFCATNSKVLYNRLYSIRNNGVNAIPENAKYELPTNVGLNLKPSNLHAAIGNLNLSNSKRILTQVKKIYMTYKKMLNNEKIKIIDNYSLFAVPIYILVTVTNQKKFIGYCKRNGIILHFALRTLDQSKLVKNKNKNCNSLFFSRNLIRLPCGPGYSIKKIIEICQLLNQYK